MSKEEERIESYKRSVAIFVALAVLFLSFLIVRPFIVAILSAGALAYIFYPVYLRLLKLIGTRTVASVITCTLIVLLVLIPAAFITFLLAYEARGGYHFLKGFLLSPQDYYAGVPPVLQQFFRQWSAYLPTFSDITQDLANQFLGLLQHFIKGVPGVALSIFITIFSSYYFFKHGKDIYRFFCDLFPLPEGRYKQILSRFDDLSRGMIMGQILVGLLQGLLAWLGFYLLGVPNPVLWGTLTAIISIIQLLGAVIVWLPIVAYLALVGTVTGEYWRAIALLAYGTLVVSAIDNLLKPKIIGDRANIHPLIILFGILGGIQLFGIPGILIGPLVLTIFDVVIEIYKESL